MLKIYITFVFFCCSLFSIGQSQIDLTGEVKGAEEESLMSATVVILSQLDSTLVSFSLTDADGLFKIENIDFGSYLIQVTYLGYEQYSKELIVDQDINPNIGTVQLMQTSTALEQIEIKGEHVPMLVKKDTLEYNAAAFQTQPNEVVEDLLRKLPGVEVDTDGTITAQGEEVQSVTVDGKKFFGDDPTIATKNLPADAVDKVQIFDKKSDMAEFSGVDDGEREKTINLELKEDRRQGQFGNAEIGYGTEDRYKGRLSLNRFSTKTQISAIGNFNNINEQGFSSADYVSFMQGIGFRRGGTGLSVNNGLSNGFVTTNAGGLNINHDFSSKLDVSVSYFLNDITNDLTSVTNRETFGSGDSFFDNDNSVEKNSATNHRFNTEINLEIDSSQDLRIRSSLVFNDGNSLYSGDSERLDAAQVVQNSSEQIQNDDASSTDLSGSATYRKKFGSVKKRILTLQANLNDSSSDYEGLLNSTNIFFNTGQMMQLVQSIDQSQLQSDNDNSYRIETSFVEPLKSNTFLELKYIRQNYNTEFLREVFDLVLDEGIINEDLSNEYVRDYVYDRAALVWHLNTDKSSLSIEGAVQNSVLQGDIKSEDIFIENKVFRFLPRVNLRHELGQSQNIRLRYSTSVNEPSITQLQPVPDNSDPINIYAGNPNLIPEYSHRIRVNYTNYDQFSFRSFFAFLNATYTRNSITNQTIINPDFTQITQPVNVDYDFNVSGNLNFSTPLNFLKTRLGIGSRLSYQNSIVFINTEENKRNRYVNRVNVKWENRKKTIFDWEVGGDYSYNITTYDKSNRNQNFSNKSVYTNLSYNIKKSFTFSTSINVDFYSEEQFGEAVTVPIWKASLSKYLLQDQKLELKFAVFDILNQNIGISRINGLNYIENSEIQSLGQYAMLSIIYAIRNGSASESPRGGRPSFRP
jgi:outer membrane receptor protein involved in Fe transport